MPAINHRSELAAQITGPRLPDGIPVSAFAVPSLKTDAFSEVFAAIAAATVSPPPASMDDPASDTEVTERDHAAAETHEEQSSPQDDGQPISSATHPHEDLDAEAFTAGLSVNPSKTKIETAETADQSIRDSEQTAGNAPPKELSETSPVPALGSEAKSEIEAEAQSETPTAATRNMGKQERSAAASVAPVAGQGAAETEASTETPELPQAAPAQQRKAQSKPTEAKQPTPQGDAVTSEIPPATNAQAAETDSGEDNEEPVLARYTGSEEGESSTKRRRPDHSGPRPAAATAEPAARTPEAIDRMNQPAATAASNDQGADPATTATAPAAPVTEPKSAPHANAVNTAATNPAVNTLTATATTSGLEARTGGEPAPPSSVQRTDAATPPKAPGGTKAEGAADGSPRTADRAILIQRISKAFQRLSVDGGQLRIRLHPEHLGSVQLQMTIQGRDVSARIIAESDAARAVLTEHLPELRQRLMDSGLQVQNLEIQKETGSATSERSPQDQQERAGQGGDEKRNRHPQTREYSPTSPRPSTATAGSSGPQRSAVEAARTKTVDLLG